MMDPTKALSLWGLEGATVNFVAARENVVYRVDHGANRYALRLHRQGYRTDAQLKSELDWMAWLKKSGLSVPDPFASISGAHLQHIEGVQVDVLTWLDGNTLDAILHDMPCPKQEHIFRQLGQNMARLHTASDEWPEAQNCDRPAWDLDGLLGQMPLWDRFWENPGLTSAQKRLMEDFRQRAAWDLNAKTKDTDFGLIHADLVPANVMWNGTTLHMIDFDDGGFGYRLFEIATALLKHRHHQNYHTIQAALIDGYQSTRFLDITALPLFMALRAVTYVGWNITRLKEDAAGTRNARFITQAEDLLTAYLNG